MSKSRLAEPSGPSREGPGIGHETALETTKMTIVEKDGEKKRERGKKGGKR